jgi:D-alanyl-D-alanine carboxypeptidase/D-alanyl-D-alanine-endopeptidase (penicillin-binding protein 4)
VTADRIAIQDGSGLSRLDLVTPRASAQLLLAISRTASSGAFRESLPIAGTDGTLEGRLKSFAGKVLAKTGSLTYDSSLSGYVTTSNGEVFSFSIMCNDLVGRGGSVKLIDQVVSILAGYPENAGKL